MRLSTSITSAVAAATAVGVYALPAQHHPSETGGLLKPSNLTHGQPAEDPQTLSRRYAAIPVYAPCPEFNKGGFVIKYPKLYPTAAAWDPSTCVLFVGSQVGPKVIVYDPYKDHILREIEIPGLEPKADYQISSIHWDMYTARWTFLATRGNWKDLHNSEAGNTIVARYDTFKNEFLWVLDLEASLERRVYEGTRLGGFHGLEVDNTGHVYIAGITQGPRYPSGKFPRTTGAIFRLYSGNSDSPHPFEWFIGTPGIVDNIRGLVAVPGSYRLLTHSIDTGYLAAFDMDYDVPGVRSWWMDSDCLSANVRILDIDSMTLPPKYNQNNVMLLTSPTKGVQVMQSFGWKWQKEDLVNKKPAYQHTFGVITPSFDMRAANAFPCDTVQVGSNSVYLVWGYKIGHKSHGRVREERNWYFEDITKDVEDNLRIKVRDGTDGQPTNWNDPNIYPSPGEMEEHVKLQDGWHLNKEWKWRGCDGYRS